MKFEEKIRTWKAENEILANKISNQQLLVEEHDSALKNHEKILSDASKSFQKYKQYLRRNNLLLYGSCEKGDENCVQLILNLLNTKMNLKIISADIESCFRIGKRIEGKTRPIIVKFYKSYDKNIAYSNKKKLKVSGLVLKEVLTPVQLNLLKAATTKAGRNGKVWTNHGVIYFKSEDEEIYKITSIEELQKLS